jgi:hypothetical protein
MSDTISRIYNVFEPFPADSWVYNDVELDLALELPTGGFI